MILNAIVRLESVIDRVSFRTDSEKFFAKLVEIKELDIRRKLTTESS